MKLTHAQLEQFHNIFSVNNLQCFGSRIQNGGWAERERERPCASAVPHMLVFSCLSYFYKWLSWRVHKLLLSFISPEQTDGVHEKLWGPRVSREAPWLPVLMFVPNNDMSRKSNRLSLLLLCPSPIRVERPGSPCWCGGVTVLSRQSPLACPEWSGGERWSCG